MKLCWLIPDDRGGGVASVAQVCCQQLAQSGHDVTLLIVLTPTGQIKSPQNFHIDSLYVSGSAENTPNTLLEWLKVNPQDILFLNACEQADTVIAYLPTKLYCVYVVHDTAPRYWETALLQECNLNGIVAVSDVVAQQFCHKLKHSEHLTIIHNGIDLLELSKNDELRSDNLLFLGGDNPCKGAYDLPKLWKQLTEQRFAGELLWAGSISPRFQASLQKLPAFSRICCLGKVPRQQIFSLASKAKVVLVLTRAESFGMATIEAMSMGCVPIAWDIETGTKEIIGKSKTGIFVPLGNTKLLAEKVLHILDRHSELEAAVMHHARTHFSSEVMGQKYEALIQTIATRPPIHRSKSGQIPPPYQPPVRKFQLLPTPLRSAIRQWVGRSPRLGYWLRDLRGF
jgi:glycosyltransferase involved in cell wall biosynthesis